MEITTIIQILLLIIIGVLVFLNSRKKSPELQSQNNNEQLEKELNELRAENGNLKGRIEQSIKVFNDQKEELDNLRKEKDDLIAKFNQAETTNKNLQQKLTEQKEEIKDIREQFTKDFQILANKILKENADEFSKTNSERLGNILNPLKEKLSSFEKQVQDKYAAQLKDTESLKTQIENLSKLNSSLQQEAENLTKALKGDSKKQGNWGEVILERILEISGLRKNEEYFTQYSDENAEGKRVQPDVIIKLPEEKHVIIDSKVSLVDYERYISAETEEEQAIHLKAHLNSVRNHIKGLSEKNYTSAKTIDAPDFVLLFLPIESSFSLAVSHDADLFNFSWERKIVLVSPSTLLATLRTIASIWKQERQTKNAQEIARQAGNLYDKFDGFLTDMLKIEKGLKSSTNAYNEAVGKLKFGKGSLVSRAEKLRQLGAKTAKKLPEEFIDDDEPNQLEIE